jgi:hypothetical protein
MLRAGEARTRRLALIAVFSVIYLVLRLVPTFPMVGIQGTFTLSDILPPLYGLLLGPAAGPASVTLGTFLAFAFGSPIKFLYLDFLPGMVNSLLVGLLVRGRRPSALALYLLILGLFLVHPYTLHLVDLAPLAAGARFPYYWLHLVALALLVSPLSMRAVGWVRSLQPGRLGLGIAVLAFMGTMLQHLMGGLLFETVPGVVARVLEGGGYAVVWSFVFWLYPGERLFLTVVSALVGVALLKGLASAGYIMERDSS